jgi:adenylate kinase
MLGPPGAGKGTQAERLARVRRLPKISTGDILREAVTAGTKVGLAAKQTMEAGNLVSDDLIIAIVQERLKQPDARSGCVLDGFPRTVAQAEALDRLLDEKGQKLDAVVELKVDEGILLKRIETRLGEMQARGETARPDDNPASFKIRLDAYRAQTAPLVDYYERKGKLKSVDGMAGIDTVSRSIDGALAGASG